MAVTTTAGKTGNNLYILHSRLLLRGGVHEEYCLVLTSDSVVSDALSHLLRVNWNSGECAPHMSGGGTQNCTNSSNSESFITLSLSLSCQLSGGCKVGVVCPSVRAEQYRSAASCCKRCERKGQKNVR